MLTGIRFKSNPTEVQKQVLSQWMGSARLIWNAKVSEERYYSTFARKYYPLGTYAPIDQKTAQFKNSELTPWLSQCPSQILRNSAVNWHQTFKKFIKGKCGKPIHKPKMDRGSIHLTRELFQFDVCADGVARLFIGAERNNIGYLSFKRHRSFKQPNSIFIKKEHGKYFLPFSYEVSEDPKPTDREHLDILKDLDRDTLKQIVVGIDRGVSVPAHTGYRAFDFTDGARKNQSRAARKIKRLQRRLAKQQKGAMDHGNIIAR